MTNTAAPWGRTADAQKAPKRGARVLGAAILFVGAIAAASALYFTMRARASRTALDVRSSVSATSERATNDVSGPGDVPAAAPSAMPSPGPPPASASAVAAASALPAPAVPSARAAASRDGGAVPPAARRPRSAAPPAPHDDLGGLIEDRH